MKKVRVLIATVGRVFLLCVGLLIEMSVSAAEGWPIETTAETAKGVWMDNFANATNLAFTTKTPMVLVWGNTGCEYCEELEKAINSSTNGLMVFTPPCMVGMA